MTYGSRNLIFQHQTAHIISLSALAAGLYMSSLLPHFRHGSFMGADTDTWVVLAAANAVAHQFYVWFCWRTELHMKLLTRLLGRSAFAVYAAVFSVLILLRPLLITAAAVSNRGTLPVRPVAGYVISGILIIPVVYVLYSVKKYFSFRRAFGIDHFDQDYRSAPLVRKGVFRFTPNAMYILGLLIFWIPGIFFRSVAAVCLAAFSHMYIWVHYYCTERPDMRIIYGEK